MLDESCLELVSMLENIVSDVVKRAISAAVSPLETKIAIHDLELPLMIRTGDCRACRPQSRSLKASLSKKCEDLTGFLVGGLNALGAIVD